MWVLWTALGEIPTFHCEVAHTCECGTAVFIVHSVECCMASLCSIKLLTQQHEAPGSARLWIVACRAGSQWLDAWCSMCAQHHCACDGAIPHVLAAHPFTWYVTPRCVWLDGRLSS
jgi:hypothetical protein